MAAAPDLLAACEAVYHWDTPMFKLPEAIRKQIGEAIKKAREGR
jgi:hypothetical protein